MLEAEGAKLRECVCCRITVGLQVGIMTCQWVGLAAEQEKVDGRQNEVGLRLSWPRMGRNPQTGEPIKIPAKTVLKFRIAKAMKELALK